MHVVFRPKSMYHYSTTTIDICGLQTRKKRVLTFIFTVKTLQGYYKMVTRKEIAITPKQDKNSKTNCIQ